MTVTNGHHPPQVDAWAAHAAAVEERLEHERVELRELLAAEDGMREQLDELAAASRERSQRLTKALDALDGRWAGRGGGPKPPKPDADRPRVYRPKAKYLDELLQLLRDSDEPLSHSVIGQRVSFSSETLTRAIRVLREEEKIRLAGTTSTGGKLYALMPEAT